MCVRRRKSAGGSFALDGAAAHPEGIGHFVDSIGQPFDQRLAFKCGLQSGQDSGQLLQNSGQRLDTLGQFVNGGLGRHGAIKAGNGRHVPPP